MSVYNGMPYLIDAVKSILNQSYKNLEFVIVDDASTDGTLKYLTSLKDKRIILVKNKSNMGLAASLNKALKKTSGKYIARMDADDISLPNRLKTQMGFLMENPSIDVCGCWADFIDKKGNITGEKKYPLTDESIKKKLAWLPPIIHPTFFAKNEFFKELGGYDLNYDYAEEYELLMRAKNKFKMANVDKKLLLWRQSDGRRSRKSWDKMEKVDLKIKWQALRNNSFGPLFAFVVAGKFTVTYLLPYQLKLKIFTHLKMI